MKVHTGLGELIIIFVFIIAAIPLMMALVRVTNMSKMSYLDDKTVYKMADSIEYKETVEVRNGKTYTKLEPVNLAPLKIDFAATQLIAVVQDDYCPEQGMIINVIPDSNTPWGDKKKSDGTYVDGSLIKRNVNDEHTLEITRGWYAKRYNVFDSLVKELNKESTLAGPGKSWVNDDFYLVWDINDNCWMITHEFVNIFQER